MKTCHGPCGRTLDDASFGKTGGKYRRNVCKRCMSAMRSPEKKQARAQKCAAYGKLDRVRNPAKYIYWDSAQSDKKAGRSGFNLTVEFIRDLIERSCEYCGETTIRMTLDRIDNDKAHHTENVVPCCIRCNYMRGNMPYRAWLFMTPGVRAAREAGAFEGWLGTPYKVKPPLVGETDIPDKEHGAPLPC